MLRFSVFYLPVLLTVIICNLINADNRKGIEVSCINEKCTEPISTAKAKKDYFPNEDFKLHLKLNEQVEVYGKSQDLWYVKANEKFGFVPSNFLKQERLSTTPQKLIRTFQSRDANVISALKKRSEDNSRNSGVKSGNSNEPSSLILSTESTLSSVSEESSKLETNETLANGRQENNQSLNADTNVTSVFDPTEHSCDATDIFSGPRTEKSSNPLVGVNINNLPKEEDDTLKSIPAELNDTINISGNHTDVLVTESQLNTGNIAVNELTSVIFNDNSSADNSLLPNNNWKKNGDVEEATEVNVGAVKISSTADKISSTADKISSTADKISSTADKISSTADKRNETDVQEAVDSPISVNVKKIDEKYDDNSQSNKDENIGSVNESIDNKMHSVGSVVNEYINIDTNLPIEGNDNLKNISVESNGINIASSSKPDVLDTHLRFNEKNENGGVTTQSNGTDIDESNDDNSLHLDRKQDGDTKDVADVQLSNDDAVKTTDKVNGNKIDEKHSLPETTDSSEKANVIKSEENNSRLNKSENISSEGKELNESDKSISLSYLEEEKQNSDIKDIETVISQESGISNTADVYSNETISEDRNNFVHNGSESSESESFESLGSIDNIETVSLHVRGDKQDNIVNDLKNIDGVIMATADVNEVLKTEHQGDGIHKGQTDYYWDMFYFSLHEFEDILYVVLEQLSLIGQMFTNKLNEMRKILVNNGGVPSTASVSNEHSEFCRSSGELSVDQINEASLSAEDLKMAESEWNNVPAAVESCDFRSSFIPWNNIFIAFTVFAVFIFCVLYYYLQRNVYNYRLIKKINELESRLFILNKEIVLLEKSEITEDMMIRNSDKVTSNVDLIDNTESVRELEAINVQLEKKVEYLEAELERVTSSALEIHQLLESSLSYQNENKILSDNLESLKKINEQQAAFINTLKAEKQNLVEENELIKEDSKIIKRNVEKLRVEYNVQTKRNLELAEKCELLKLQLDEKCENSRTKEENYKLEIDKLRKNINSLELSLRKQHIKKIETKVTNQAANENESSLQNESVDRQQPNQSNDELAGLQSYNTELAEELSSEKSARLSLEDSLKELTEEVKKWEGKYRTLELEKSDLGVKLQVLTDYFKEKEANFRKEIESKNSIWIEKENSESLFLHKITLLQAELDNIKAENEALKNEIFEQEKSYKMQLANMEQKSRDHWFALRQAERKYKESEREAANLRNKILVLETNKSNNQKTDAINTTHFIDDSVVNGVSKELIPDYFGNSVISTDIFGPSEFIPLPPPPLPNDDGEFFPPEPLYSPERLSPLGGRRPSSPPPPPLIDPDDSDFLTRNKYPSHIQHHDRNSTVDSLSSLSTRRSTPPIHRRINQFRGSARHRHADQESLSSGLSENSLDKEIP